MNLLQRTWLWIRVNILDTHCECGGRWKYIGESGFLTCTIHEACTKCGTQRSFLLEH